MKISCSRKIEAEEGLKVEFKSSLLFAPNNAPSYIQQEAIAKTICAFINTEGGNLYLGVNDSGYSVGVSSDIKELAVNSRRFVTKGMYATDEGYSYRQTIDQLYLKFQKIIEAYLGKMALQYILDYEKKEEDSNVYLVIPVKSADIGDFVYFVNHQGKPEIWIRTPGANRILVDKDRDEFIAAKAKERHSQETDRLLTSIHTRLSTMLALKTGNRGHGQRDTDNAESLDHAIESLMSEISAVLFPHEYSLGDCIEYYALYDKQTSSMTIMDEFEKTCDGKKIYGRMVLSRDPALCSLPYRWEESDRCFHRINGCDFGLNWVSLLIERCPTGNALIDISYRDSFTFSDLKEGYVRQLHEIIWDSIAEELKSAPFAGWHTVLFKQFLGLKAHNSFSNVHSVNIPQYKIVGVRFSKYKLVGLDKIVEPRNVMSPSDVRRAYDQLCEMYSAPYEQRKTCPSGYREAKQREHIKAEKMKGRDADLDVLELPIWQPLMMTEIAVYTVGDLVDLTDEAILARVRKAKASSILRDNIFNRADQDLCAEIMEIRQKAKEYLRKMGIVGAVL